jgi:hypothetical protein
MRAGLDGLAAGFFTFGWLVSFGVIIWRLPLGDVGAIIVSGLATLSLPISLLAGLQTYRRLSGRYRMQHALRAERGHPHAVEPSTRLSGFFLGATQQRC